MCVVTPDADVEVEGVPVAPLDVCCHDANKDYVVVTWKQPAVEGSSSILGYYIDRWVRRAVATVTCSILDDPVAVSSSGVRWARSTGLSATTSP